MAFHGTLQYSLEFHGPPRKLHGISWHSMELHHYFMELRGTPWHSMELHGYSMELHAILWNSMDTPWKFRGIPWISINFHGIPWISIDFHGFPWISMEFHGIPWRYFTRVSICIYLSGFDKRYLQKFQVRFNNLTLEVNKNQLKVASLGLKRTN